MNCATHLEHRASSSQSKHEGEPSFGLCDRLDRTRANSQRQLPTDHDYAVPTREYQTDQSSLKPAQAAARPVLAKEQLQKQTHRPCSIDRVTPYQAKARVGPTSPCCSGTMQRLSRLHEACGKRSFFRARGGSKASILGAAITRPVAHRLAEDESKCLMIRCHFSLYQPLPRT
jgi:hypothetical protein